MLALACDACLDQFALFKSMLSETIYALMVRLEEFPALLRGFLLEVKEYSTKRSETFCRRRIFSF